MVDSSITAFEKFSTATGETLVATLWTSLFNGCQATTCTTLRKFCSAVAELCQQFLFALEQGRLVALESA